MAGITILKDSCRMYIGPDLDEASADRPLALADKVTSATSFSDFGADVEEIDVTTLDSKAKETEAGFDDWGSITVEQNITSDEYTKMNAWRRSKETLKFGIVAANKRGEVVFGVSGKCFVKTCKWGGATVGGRLTVSTELRLTGDVDDTFEEPTA